MAVLQLLGSNPQRAGGGRGVAFDLEACHPMGAFDADTLSTLDRNVRACMGVEILPGYGLTEAFHFVIATPRGRVRPGAAGAIIPGFEARVVGPDGREVPPGEIGTLEVRGRTLGRY